MEIEFHKKMCNLQVAVAILAALSLGFLAGKSGPSLSCRYTDISSVPSSSNHNHISILPNDAGPSGATGERFRGQKTRDFPAEKKVDFYAALQQPNSNALRAQKNSSIKQNSQCDKWVVITTIYEPSEAVHKVAHHLLTRQQQQQSNDRGWCLVIVADTKTPANYMSSVGQWDTLQLQHTVFLSVKDQEAMAQGIPFVATMPFRSFARKNVGYLYAIQQGAKIIFDLDDDNELRAEKGNATSSNEGKQILDLFTPQNTVSMEESVIPVRQYETTTSYPHRVVNPFPHMGATVPGTWPRGFPLNLVQSDEALGKVDDQETTLPLSQVGVIQSVCNQDPDVDAVYRLTRPLPFEFKNDNAQTSSLSSLVIPPKLYVPYNAQATLHYPNAYWGMYLPITVNGRVSDIWRSYFMQRIMRELEQPLHLVYSPALVTQIRNAHDYIGDMKAEDHLYMRTETLLEFLDEWKPTAAANGATNALLLPLLIQDLWIQLYERRYVEEADVVAVQQWLLALQEGGYQFPSVQKLQ